MISFVFAQDVHIVVFITVVDTVLNVVDRPMYVRLVVVLVAVVFV